jgi:hypothetical protein
MRAYKDGFITGRRAVELMHGQIQESDLPAYPEGDMAP